MRRVGMLLLLVVVAVLWWQVDDFGAETPREQTGVSQLPAEARETIELIDAGGPFPYGRDGAVFQNRERRLPERDRGYWREYTVPTPGSDDRGARRLVEGRDGELFYTGDHYRSFRQVRGPS